MAKIGDYVRFLNSVGGGKVVRIEGNIAYVEDEDGFEVPALTRECVVVGEASAKVEATLPANAANDAARKSRQAPPVSSVPLMEPQPKAEPEPDALPLEETPYGDVLNVQLAFEPADIKQLSHTTYEAVLINDSNYYLDFVFATHGDDTKEWTLRRASVVEPNIVLSLGDFTGAELNEMSHLLLQFVAYKDDKPFVLKAPVSVTTRIDTTKFFKLHCFRPSRYSDTPVIAVDIVKDDKPYAPQRVDAAKMEEAMRSKAAADRRPATRPVRRREPAKGEIIEVDLHINELVDTTAGLSRADMLNLQIDEFRRVMDANLRRHGQKIVFIHGKGEGVLRNALLKELSHRYKGHDVCDASFREYGFGATQVTIK